MASTTSSHPLPSGCGIFTTIPDLLFIPEFVFGGLVWTLVASTKVLIQNPQGWVMFVSIFCFVVTTLWFIIFISGMNQKGSFWPTLDVAYHAIATTLYLSASVAQAYVTIQLKDLPPLTKYYHEDIAAVVMAYAVTLLYAVHTIFSAIRWKSC
ncbi:myelin and lymphocyte protein-like [Megalops cyprinoides]|uniref:myelin and lymphocyte protein-like n=1 Tax=Megalops cyprinoides TaxID=118141 RepID=UPI001864FBD7|nr:myelin and lymphocyte protein-like [Megalops cyprinoides]